ncbi:MAG: bifunctional folylpolyglutamate synthase/dihydrofolate synthase, partial [Bacteroidetes bacterium]|nr:bifunctional folylpolyglutamate synthase/dihydrofolate synthase [Bacteroidota bacterium]
LGLDNIKHFLSFIGNPQLKLKAIHIAGSNGKGSTAAFISSILMEAGYKVGLYTSPHFVRFNERITINGKQIDNKSVAEFITIHWDFIIEHQLTFFEVTTAISFEYFYNNEVDYAIIETGLGGRLDATNVLNPLAVVITSISLEHTNVLGNKISLIAQEKAAIIKKDTRVFTAILPKEADTIVEQKCKEENSELFRLDEYINEKDDVLELYTEEIELDEWNVPLKGRFQIYNSALAALVTIKSFLCEDKIKILKGISNVVTNTKIEGRYEFIHRQPTIILDSAHNIAGIKQFLSEFKKDSDNYGTKIVLFGAMRDKAIGAMLIELNKYFDEIHLTEIKYERSANIKDLKNICDNIGITASEEPDALNCINNFLKGKKENCLVVLGSMYLLGDVKKSLIL